MWKGSHTACSAIHDSKLSAQFSVSDLHQQTQGVHSVVFKGRTSVGDCGPALKQNGVIVLGVLGYLSNILLKIRKVLIHYVHFESF